MASVKNIYIVDIIGIGISEQHRFYGSPNVKYGSVIKISGLSPIGTEKKIFLERVRITSIVVSEIE